LALLGLADATYLTFTHYTGGEVACSIIKGCEQVLTSKYSEFYGVPLAAAGIVYYADLFLALSFFKSTNDKRYWKFFQAILGVGVLASAVFIWLQLGVIQAICQYCMVSAGLTAIMAVTTIIISRNNNEQARQI
jgi:uncharacterized membrane protein